MNWIIQNLGWPTILILIGGILTLVGGVWSAIEKNLTDKEINQNTQKIKETLISAESFCYLLPSEIKMKPPSLGFLLLHQGQNPIYNLQVRIALLEEHEELRQKKGSENSRNIDLKKNIGDVGIDKVLMINGRILPNHAKYTFDIYYEHLHGRYMQVLELYRFENEMKYRSVIKSYGPKEEIYHEFGNINQNEIDELAK